MVHDGVPPAHAQATPLATPSDIVTTPFDGGVIVDWGAVTSASSGYSVEYKEQFASTATTLSPSPTTNTATITGLTNGRFYVFRVQASRVSATVTASEWSDWVTTMPRAATTMVANVAQTGGLQTITTQNTSRSQGFTTGSNPVTLESIEVDVVTALDATATAKVRAELWSAKSDGSPNARLAVLTVPSTLPVGRNAFIAPTGTSLAPSTTYHLVFYTTASQTLSLQGVTADDEDSGGAGGWTVANTLHSISVTDPNSPGSASWGTGVGSFRIAVKGYPSLVSNLSQTDASPTTVSHSTSSGSQAFTTGSNSAGYTLSSIDVNVSTALNATAAAKVKAELWSANADGSPNARLETLTVPSTLSAGVNALTAPLGTVLAPETAYHLVIYTTASQTLVLSVVAKDTEDSGAAAGWSIANARYTLDAADPHSPGSVSWTIDTTFGESLKIAVKGAARAEGSGKPIWSGTLNAVNLTGDFFGCAIGFTVCATSSVLSNWHFAYEGQSRSVVDVFHRNDASDADREFTLKTTLIGDAAFKELTLHVGGRTFAVADATVNHDTTSQTASEHTSAAVWTATGMTWAATDTIRVILTIPEFPPAPVDLYTYRANQALVLDWNPARDDDNRAVGNVTGYDVEYKTAAAPDAAATTANDPTTGWVDAGHSGGVHDSEITIANLTNDTTYNLRVRSVNAGGGSPWATAQGTPEHAAAVWTATLRAKDLGGGEIGCSNTAGGKQCSNAAVLDDDDFLFKGTEYHFTKFYTAGGELAFDTDRVFHGDFDDDGILIVDGAIYPLDKGSTAGNHDGMVWFGVGLPRWAAGDTVTLTLQILGLVATTAPADLEARSGAEGIWVSWTGQDAADGYDVEYKTTSASSWTDAGHTGTDPSKGIPNLVMGTTYDVRVRAKNDAGESGWSQAQATAGGTPVVSFSPTVYEQTVQNGTTTMTEVTVSIQPVLLEDSSATLSLLTADPEHTAPAFRYDNLWANMPSLTLPAGETSASYEFNVFDATAAYKDQKMVIGLSAITSAPYSLGAGRAVLTIADNDYVTVSYQSGETIGDNPVFRVAEGGTARLNVVLDRSAFFSVPVNLTTSADSDTSTADATETTDYVVDVASTAFASGQRAPVPLVGIRTVADSVSDDNERLLVSLSLPTGRPDDELVQVGPDAALVIIGPATTTTPDAPVSVIANGRHQRLVVTWLGPTQTTTGYDVEYKESTATSWTDAGHSGVVPTHTITGLANGVAYDVRVRSKNSAAGTPNGAWATTVQGTPETTAEDAVEVPYGAGGPAPVTLAEVVAGNSALTVAWPIPAGGPLEGYEVQYKASTATNWRGAGHRGLARFITLQGLDNGTSYDVRVRARKAGAVVGAWSQTKSGTPEMPDLPAPPRAATATGTGAFDLTFDGDGQAVTAVGSSHDFAHAIAVQSDGKVVVAGGSDNGSNWDFALVRYGADGSLDAGFGTGGKVTTPIGSGHDRAHAVAVQRDGRIVAAGFSHNGSNQDFALARYTRSGALDTSFGTGGKVTTAIGSGHDQAYAVAVQADGKILVAGYSHNGTDNDFALVRYTRSGQLDATFGEGGMVVTDFDGGDDQARAIALLYLGKIVVAGHATYGSDGSGMNFALVRYDADGTPDAGFGDGGRVVTDFGGGSDAAHAVTAQPGGLIVAAGASGTSFALARYNSYGALDQDFGNGGKVVTSFGSSHGAAHAVAAQLDGKIIAGGSGDANKFALARYDEWGRPDPLFGTGGQFAAPVGSTSATANAMALLPDGKVVLAGHNVSAANADFVVARYLATPGKGQVNSVEPASGGTSLEVAWRQPLGTVTGYDLEYRLPDDAWTDAGHTGAGTSTAITGLATATAYEVRVRATNGIGAGPWSNARRGETSGVAGNNSPPDQAGVQPTIVTLSLDAATVGESGGSVTVTATLDAPAPEGGIGGFLFAGADGTAVEGIDFTMPLGVFIPGGDRSASATISITDDSEDEADETVVISAMFDLGTAVLEDTITLTITDDDTAGVSITAASPLAVDEGAAATYTVVLDSQPTSDVTISATSGDGDAVSVSPASHTFTSSTWSTAQTFTVTGVTDADTNDESTGVSHSVTSADAKYAAALVGTVRVSVSDTTTPPPQQQNRAPTVASAIGDITGMSVGDNRDIALSGVFSDPDGDSLTYAVESSDQDVAWAYELQGTLTVLAVASGTATITVTAEDPDGERVSDQFSVTVSAPQQPNRAPTVASAIADATIVNQSGTQSVSLSGVFSDADSDALTVTAASSDTAVATVSVAAGGSSLTVSAQSRGMATITVTADDGNGGTVQDTFTITVKATPTVATTISDVSGLEAGTTRDISLSGVFSDADNDALSITASSSDTGKATVSAADGSRVTLTGVAEGTATITVTAQDADGNRVSDEFTVAVEAPSPPPEEKAPSDGTPTVAAPLEDISLRGPMPREISLVGVFNDPDGDSLTITAVSSHHHIASMWTSDDYSTLTVVGISTGTATITVTARDADGNEVTDEFEVTVSPAS